MSGAGVAANDGAKEGSVVESGHQLSEHGGDFVIEAWGPDASSCLIEALSGLVESFAVIEETPTSNLRPLATPPCGAEDALVTLLEEVIFVLDVDAELPVHFHLAPTTDGGFAGDMEVVPAENARLVGPLPKAVSYHGLSMSSGEDGWRCHVLVDR